jgi:cell division initiation protein
MVAEAEAQAQAKIASLRQEALVAENRLQQGQMELARFIEMSRQVCNKQLAFLEELPELPVAQAAVAVETEVTAAAIEETIMAAVAEQKMEEEVAVAEPVMDDYPEGDPFADPAPVAFEAEVSEPTRRINLSELKFGRNYKGDE